MTPARIDPPDYAQTTLDACKRLLARRKAAGAVLLAAGVCHPAQQPDTPGCLMYEIGGAYILYPLGYMRPLPAITPEMWVAVRRYHGLSQLELGGLLGVTEDAIANKERGRSRISPADIAALAAVLKGKK